MFAIFRCLLVMKEAEFGLLVAVMMLGRHKVDGPIERRVIGANFATFGRFVSFPRWTKKL